MLWQGRIWTVISTSLPAYCRFPRTEAPGQSDNGEGDPSSRSIGQIEITRLVRWSDPHNTFQQRTDLSQETIMSRTAFPRTMVATAVLFGLVSIGFVSI